MCLRNGIKIAEKALIFSGGNGAIGCYMFLLFDVT